MNLTIVFDPEKDESNFAKHKHSLSEANSFEWSDSIEWVDDRKDYRERRMITLGYIGLRLMHLVFVDRPEDEPIERRVISLRKANLREIKRYANA